jgi:hypothetical protein
MTKHFDLNDFAIAKRCNASEYAFVVSKLVDLLGSVDKTTLTMPKGVFEQFQAGASKMLDIINTSRATAETTKIENLDKQINKYLVYILGVVRLAKDSGIENKSEAARELYCITKMYNKVRRSPRRQKNAQIISLICDLNNPKNAQLVKTLGISDEVDTLKNLNEQYLELLNRRANIQVRISKDKPALIRKEMNGLLNIMLTCTRCAYYNNPTEELKRLILSINKLFSDITTEYKQRLAHRKKTEDNPTQELDSQTKNGMEHATKTEVTTRNYKTEHHASDAESYKPYEEDSTKPIIIGDTREQRIISGGPRVT